MTEAPVSFKEAVRWLEHFVYDPVPWIKEAAEGLYGCELESTSELDERQRVDLMKRLQLVVLDLEDAARAGQSFYDGSALPTLRDTFARRFEGLVVAREYKAACPF